MQCNKCNGLMVADSLIDTKETGIPIRTKGWRCVSCGNIVDPVIQQHRMIQQTSLSASRFRHPVT